MPKLNTTRAGRTAIAAALLLPLISVSALLIEVSPAAAGAHAAAKKKSKGFTVRLNSGTLTLAFTAASWSKISGGSPTVGVTTTPTEPATSTPTGTFAFPIRGGSLNSLTGRGLVSAKGGLTISSHLSIGGLFESSSTASASLPFATLGSSSTLTLSSANFRPAAVAMFKLATAHVKAVGSRHSVTINRIPASLTPAGLQFFGTSFKAGETVATVSIAAKG